MKKGLKWVDLVAHGRNTHHVRNYAMQLHVCSGHAMVGGAQVDFLVKIVPKFF